VVRAHVAGLPSLACAVALLLGAACSGPVETDPRARLPERSSDGGGSEAAPDAASSSGPSCSNGARDGDESDVDCGGALCPPCANGSACTAPTDCVSLVCAEGTCENDAGCSDGTREAFASVSTFPNIAACAGGWAIAGLVTTTAPACGRAAGNDSANEAGEGCNVADLCQAGWHVCTSAAEVAAKSGDGTCAGAVVEGQNAFFVVRESGGGNAQCGVGTNDLFGCGDVGLPPDAATCAPLDRFSNDLCSALPATWSCGADSADEANHVTKTASEGGGVLCCRD
jgi:hypothetical protein